MIRRPPRSTRTDTLFPYTTLFRSSAVRRVMIEGATMQGNGEDQANDVALPATARAEGFASPFDRGSRSEEHTSELQSLMRISYAVFCLKKKKKDTAKDRKHVTRSEE